MATSSENKIIKIIYIFYAVSHTYIHTHALALKGQGSRRHFVDRMPPASSDFRQAALLRVLL